ncbi:MAG: phosphotransferase family protein [Deltaproteobacteria bacterium]|nr:phosphotransferase family protein [Deltaproteobacteria bacterium]MBW2421280.1 phosphotransferase family protein [Deltaproteobacteria bacterium]
MAETTSEMAAPLEKALKSNAPQLQVERVLKVERFTSGLSSQSYCISVENAEGPTRWVMRVEPEFGVIPPYDIGREYRLLGEAGKAGLPVPGVLHLEEDASVVGGRFMLMSFVEGEIYKSMDPRLAADAELTTRVQERFVEMLARIHETPQGVLPSYADGPESARGEVAVCRRRLLETELLPSPIMRHALDVLDEHAPPAQRIALLHGDYRLPNLMWKDGEISGILDWELARVGDPLSDLAFTQTIGRGPCSVEGELAARYSERTGIEIDDRRLLYYRLLEMVKGSIIGLAGAYDLANGGCDLRLLSVARIAAAGQAMMGILEAQLEEFLEA